MHEPQTVDVGKLLDGGHWRSRQKFFVFLTALTIVFDGIDNQLLGIAIPSIMRDWAVTRAAFAPVVSFGFLGMMIGGAVAALYGVLYWQFSKAFADVEANSGSGSTGFSDTVRNIGFVVIGAGVVVEIIGIVMFSGGTSVQVR